jgi:hypothetical protein
MLISDDDELPLGHPMLRPESEVVFVSRDAEMDAEEERLRHALLAASPDGCRDIATAADLSAFLAISGVQDDNLVVCRFAPECLLVIFSTSIRGMRRCGSGACRSARPVSSSDPGRGWCARMPCHSGTGYP